MSQQLTERIFPENELSASRRTRVHQQTSETNKGGYPLTIHRQQVPIVSLELQSAKCRPLALQCATEAGDDGIHVLTGERLSPL